MPDIPKRDSQVPPETLPVVAHSTNSDGTAPNERVKQVLSLREVPLPTTSVWWSSLPEWYILLKDGSGNYYMKNTHGSAIVQLEKPQGLDIFLGSERHEAIPTSPLFLRNEVNRIIQVYWGENGVLQHALRNEDGSIYWFYGECCEMNHVTELYHTSLPWIYFLNSDRPTTWSYAWGLNILRQSELNLTSINWRTYIQCSWNVTGQWLYRDITNRKVSKEYFIIEGNTSINLTLTPSDNLNLFSNNHGILVPEKNGDDVSIHYTRNQLFKDENGDHYIWTWEQLMSLDNFIPLYNATVEKNWKRVEIGNKELIWWIAKPEERSCRESNVYFFEKRNTKLPNGKFWDIWVSTEMHLPESYIDASGNLKLLRKNDIIISPRAENNKAAGRNFEKEKALEALDRMPLDWYIFLWVSINSRDSPQTRYDLSHTLSPQGDISKIPYEAHIYLFPVPNSTKMRLGDFFEDFGYVDGIFFWQGNWAKKNIKWYLQNKLSETDSQTHVATNSTGHILTYIDRNGVYVFVITSDLSKRKTRFMVCTRGLQMAWWNESYVTLMPSREQIQLFTEFLKKHGYTWNMNEFLQEGGGQELLA